MTSQELQSLINIMTTQTIDLVQTTVEKMLGVNHVENFQLSSGETTIVFANPYLTGETWGFLKLMAINDDGIDIGVTVSNKTKDGFKITVDEDCKLTYRTEFYKTWISD